MTDIINTISDLVWGPYMIILLLGTGLFLTVRLGFFQFSKFGYIMRNTFGKAFHKGEGEGEISSGQAGFSSIAAVVGTGNIAGVATAIVAGGPGAVFWMWLAALLGMATKMSEITLGIKYREVDKKGEFVGGPMYYLKNGLNNKFFAYFFAVLTIITYFVVGAIVDTNTMVLSVQEYWGVKPVITGVILAIASFAVIMGGIKSIGNICEKLTPFMGALYVIAGLAVIILNITKVPAAFALIFKSAFTPMSATGGFAGATVSQIITMGAARGMFSNEAGIGSSPILHSSAQVSHPMEQGIWGVAEVFFDTIIICTITALTIIISGEWTSGLSGVALTMNSFGTALGSNIGHLVVMLCSLLFGFSCLITVNYYCEVAGKFLFGEKSVLPIRILWPVFIVIGSMGGLETVWNLADASNGLMAIPNLIGVLFLSSQVVKLKKEYTHNHNLD